MQDNNSFRVHKQGEPRKQTGHAAPKRGDKMKQSSGAGSDAARGANGGQYVELLEWASNYAEVAEEDNEADLQRDGPPLSPLAQPIERVLARRTQEAESHNRDLMYVFEKYICKRVENHGVTIMLHNVPYNFQVDPDIFKLIKTLRSINAVDYIYLPMAVDRPCDNRSLCRNKGYCFIHFCDMAAAQSFVEKIYNYTVPAMHYSYDDGGDLTYTMMNQPPGGKGMFVVMAKFQGVSLNLNNLLDIHSKKWRPKNGCCYVRTDSGLSCVRLLSLRNLATQYEQLSRNGSTFDAPLCSRVVGSNGI